LHVETGNAGQRLSAAQIMQLFPGTFEGVYAEDMTIIIEASPDGALSGTMGYLSDTGRWGLDGNQICIRWDTWLSRKVKCRYVEYVNGWYRAVKDDGRWRLRLRRLS
jgi:hypothetical protein